MNQVQYELFLTMLIGLRMALLTVVDALEMFLVANGRLKQRTSEIRKQLKSQSVCDTIPVAE